MAKEWTVETEKLVAAATILEGKIGEYKTQWEKLYTEVENLKSSKWKGIASDTFNTQIEGYRNDFQALYNTLVSFKDFLNNAAKKYEGTENAVKEAAGNLSTGQ